MTKRCVCIMTSRQSLNKTVIYVPHMREFIERRVSLILKVIPSIKCMLILLLMQPPRFIYCFIAHMLHTPKAHILHTLLLARQLLDKMLVIYIPESVILNGGVQQTITLYSTLIYCVHVNISIFFVFN